MEAVLVVLSYPCGPPPKFLDSILVFFEVPCFSLLQWLSTLRMLSKAKSIPSPLKMHGSPSLKLLKSETRDKMKHMFNFSLRSSSVHSPCPLVISRFKKDMWQYCVCILWTCMQYNNIDALLVLNYARCQMTMKRIKILIWPREDCSPVVGISYVIKTGKK